jgi:protease I
MERVLIVVGDASETLDTLYPVLRLQEDDFEPVVAAPERRRYQLVLHEQPAGWDVTRETEGYTIEAAVAFRDVDPTDYVGVFFSGGRAPEYLRYDPELVRSTRAFFEARKPVGCVCHGIEIPAHAGCLAGRRVTTVAKCRAEVLAAGATYVDEPSVVDGALVTGRTYHDCGRFVGAWLRLLREARG